MVMPLHDLDAEGLADVIDPAGGKGAGPVEQADRVADAEAEDPAGVGGLLLVELDGGSVEVGAVESPLVHGVSSMT